MNQDDYIKQLEKQIDDLQKQYGENEVRIFNYEWLMNMIVKRSKIRHVNNARGVIKIETTLDLDAHGIIESNSPLAEFVTKALIELEKQEASELALALFIESGATGIELPDHG